jgi:hypothetical protein
MWERKTAYSKLGETGPAANSAGPFNPRPVDITIALVEVQRMMMSGTLVVAPNTQQRGRRIRVRSG